MIGAVLSHYRIPGAVGRIARSPLAPDSTARFRSNIINKLALGMTEKVAGGLSALRS
jgi:hypothetical protein